MNKKKHDTKQIGIRLKTLRKTFKYSQREISEFLDISQSKMSLIEQGKRSLQSTDLEALCNLYCCDEEFILYSKGKMEKVYFTKEEENH